MLLYFALAIFISFVTSQTVPTNYNVDITQEYSDSYYPSIQWSDSFDWKLLKVLANQSSNVLISPLSLRLVLAILYEGSSGSTQREFEQGLKFSKKSTVREQFKESLNSLQRSANSDNVLKISTNLFLDSEIEPKDNYADLIKTYYYTDVVGTNFSDTVTASDEINSWASQATFGLVPHLIDSDSIKDMTMLLANAVYFKGLWKHHFPKENTHIDKFYITPEQSIYIPFMSVTEQFYYYESTLLDAKILRLPYKNSDFSMFIVLPLSKGGLPDLIRRINLADLHRELYSLNKKLIQVSIPKFKFRFKSSYSSVLKYFGFRTMFQNTASFPKIAKGNTTVLRKIVINDILQTTGIEIDEEGSIAYAATDVIIGNKIGLSDTFNATQPFLFFIQEDKEGVVFYVGKVENPLLQDLELKPIQKDDDNLT
ncbi:hypothetical protein GWI33_018352 [Rhynchophorus ferrugineus]|uniref:Serpin domain-containing protein n=1 Tax=Rhynchophorus ferrugineus TaxID=354439 RepID=A0A834HX35_RHYFE|nr:hypothetical protein GWI33_018352 [Rhynchophorus ferrugineus]